jgi:type II restriction/modification system DNA methylase subunit YeeA
MLVYAFDLLYAIYEEEGYEPAEIPEKILTLNLFGIEIDERAGELAAFALTMKARAKHRRFFNKGIKPNICVLGNVEWEVGSEELGVGSGEFLGVRVQDLGVRLEDLLHDLRLFGEANNFGSLLRPRLSSVQVESVRSALTNHWSLIPNPSLFDNQTHEKVLRVLRQADFLSSKYHVVIANPPYMGGKGMNAKLAAWVKNNFPDSKSDLFAVFTERIMELVPKGGFMGLMTPFTWMFLSSYEKLRLHILNKNTITSLVRPEYHAFFESAYVPICAFTLFRQTLPSYQGAFIDLQKFYGADLQPVKALEAIKNPDCGWFYRASADDFKKIPSSAIAYWVSKRVLDIFATSDKLSDISNPAVGLQTGDNDRFIKLWFEVAHSNIGFGLQNRKEAQDSRKKWFPYNKGGEFRKWYGNQEYVVNWENDGYEIRNFGTENGGKSKSRPQNTDFYFQECITWSFISSSSFGVRFSPKGFVFDVGGSSLFTEKKNLIFLTTLLCSKITFDFMKVMNPTLNFQVGNVASIPIVENKTPLVENIGSQIIDLSREDWDFSETSWDFKNLPLLQSDHRQSTFEATYIKLCQHWQQTTLEMQRLEEENNRIFIEAYGLQDELTPDVPLKEITLTCNPHYRYDSNKSESELATLLLADTMREFISYAVGCMFGRYSIDKEGLILANQGEGIEDYLRKVGSEEIQVESDKWKVESEKIISTLHSPLPTPHSLLPTPTNVIPIIEGDWFTDDISEQFRKFLRLTFGEENYQTNLTFIEKALDKPIQKYFLKDFYNDHIKRYKKRPIYWLFSSPKGNFNALIYLHRYRPDTASIVLNDYLREYRAKLTAHKTHLEAVSIDQNATQSEKTKALKTIENLRKIIDELEKYERDILYPLASQQLAIDLDDGVKVNYVKFGAALKKIAGLDAAED